MIDGFGGRVKPRDLAQSLRRDAAHRRHFLRREIDDARLQFLESFGVAGDVLVVGQPFRDDRVQHRVQQSDVAARLEREMRVGRGGDSACRRGSMTMSLAPLCCRRS